jgi:hypothetical protein
MRMVQEGLAPGVEDAQNAERRAQVLACARHLKERRGTGLEEKVVQQPFVLQRESREGVRQGEHDMGVRDRQQLAFPLGEPLIARVRQHLGQCRSRHELNEMARCPQAVQRSR